MKKLNKSKALVTLAAIMLFFHFMPESAFAVGAGDIQAKVNEGLKQIQTFLTGIVVTVGICVSLFIIIKKLPGVDDPHTKNEMFRGVGMVLAGVGTAAALVWIVPWMYQLFV